MARLRSWRLGGGLGYGGGFGRVLMWWSPALGLIVPEKYPVEHECADKREHAHADAKAVAPKRVVVDQRDAKRGENHDRQREQESDSPMNWHHPVERIQRHLIMRLASGLGQRLGLIGFRRREPNNSVIKDHHDMACLPSLHRCDVARAWLMKD